MNDTTFNAKQEEIANTLINEIMGEIGGIYPEIVGSSKNAKNMINSVRQAQYNATHNKPTTLEGDRDKDGGVDIFQLLQQTHKGE